MKITLILQIYLTTIIYYSLFCHLLGTKSGESFQRKEFCKQIEFVLITAWWHPVCQSGEGASSIWAFKQTMTFSTASHLVWLVFQKIYSQWQCPPHSLVAPCLSGGGGGVRCLGVQGDKHAWLWEILTENHLSLKYKLEKRLRSVYVQGDKRAFIRNDAI